MKALSGKIAALPFNIREQLNRRLLDGQNGPRILPWLNGLPAVKTILAEQYAAKPINHQNLSYWRADGYQRWYEENKPYLLIKHHDRDAKKYARAARNLAAGADAIVADRLFQAVQDPNLSTEDLLKLHPTIKSIRKADQQDVHLKLAKYKVRQKDAQLFLQRDIHQRDVVAIGHRLLKDEVAKYFVDSPCTYEEKIEIIGRHMFGDLWQPRFIPKDTVVPLPARLGGQPSAADGAGKRTQASASDSADKNRGPQPPQEPTSSLANPQKTPPNDPLAAPKPPGEGGSNILPISDLDQGKPAATQLSTFNPQLASDPDEPDTSDIPCPQITPGKTTQQLIAEIEDYAIQVSAARKARRKSPLAAPKPLGEGGSSCRNRGDEALNENDTMPVPSVPSSTSAGDAPPQAPTGNLEEVRSFSPGLEQSDYPGSQPQSDEGSMPEASRAASPRAHLPLPPRSKQPLSDYEKARLEGKSHLEAMYLQFTPTPEELARRKRANEELRRASEPLAAPKPLGEGGSPINPQQFYGPCLAPYSWQGHRPLDPWKVHTS